MTLGSLDVVLYTCLFLVPGFIIDDIVNAFCTSKKRDTNIAILRYLMFSVIHCALWAPAYIKLVTLISTAPTTVSWLYIGLVSVVGAFFTGLVLGFMIRGQFLHKIFALLGINVSLSIPTSWDYKFSTIEWTRWVIIYLACDKTVYGLLSTKSYASIDSSERDIYVEKVYTLDENKKWIMQTRSDGMLIPKDQIRFIEILHDNEEAANLAEKGFLFNFKRKNSKKLEDICAHHHSTPPDVDTAAMATPKPAQQEDDDHNLRYQPIYCPVLAQNGKPSENQGTNSTNCSEDR